MFHYTIHSSDSLNGLHPINSLHNSEITKLLNEGRKYKFIVSKFMIYQATFETANLIDEYNITVSINNISFNNSFYNGDIGKSVLRTKGDIIYEDGTTNYLVCEYENWNVQNGTTTLISSDRIIENGYLNIDVQYYDAIGQEYVIPSSSEWIMEFYIIFE